MTVNELKVLAQDALEYVEGRREADLAHAVLAALEACEVGPPMTPVYGDSETAWNKGARWRSDRIKEAMTR